MHQYCVNKPTILLAMPHKRFFLKMIRLEQILQKIDRHIKCNVAKVHRWAMDWLYWLFYWLYYWIGFIGFIVGLALLALILISVRELWATIAFNRVTKPYTEYTYLGTKIDQWGDNTTGIKHRINQTRKAINALNSIWWYKNITKDRKLYIYQTIIQSILVYGAEVWQIPTREINRILPTEMDVLRRSAKKSRMERTKNESIKEIMGVKRQPDIIDIIEKKRL